MDMNEFLIEAHKSLDAATVEDGLGNEALCMLHLGRLHGLLRVLHNNLPSGAERRCKVCGCTDAHACPEGCHWVEADLCSSCV